MRYALLSETDRRAIDALKAHYGGAAAIGAAITEKRDFATRKRILGEKGFGEMIADAERLVERFAKVSDFEREIGFAPDTAKGVATAQVSGFQGAPVTHRAMQRFAESAGTGEPCWVPSEMISVVALTEHYV